MRINKDLIPEGWEGKKLSLIEKVTFDISIIPCILFTLISIPADLLANPINYFIGEDIKWFTKKGYYTTKFCIKSSIKGEIPYMNEILPDYNKED